MRGTREPGPPYTPRPRTNASTHAHKTPTLTHNTHASMHACTMHADALWEEVASTSAIDVIKVRCASACCCWLASVRTARAMRASVLALHAGGCAGRRAVHRRVSRCDPDIWWPRASCALGGRRRWAQLDRAPSDGRGCVRVGGAARPPAPLRYPEEPTSFQITQKVPCRPPASAALVGSRRVTQIDVVSTQSTARSATNRIGLLCSTSSARRSRPCASKRRVARPGRFGLIQRTTYTLHAACSVLHSAVVKARPGRLDPRWTVVHSMVFRGMLICCTLPLHVLRVTVSCKVKPRGFLLRACRLYRVTAVYAALRLKAAKRRYHRCCVLRSAYILHVAC